MEQQTKLANPNKKKKTYAQIKKEQAIKNTQKEKQKYFAYYDDIKSHTHDLVDW